jgi:hypothetical protein
MTNMVNIFFVFFLATHLTLPKGTKKPQKLKILFIIAFKLWVFFNDVQFIFYHIKHHIHTMSSHNITYTNVDIVNNIFVYKKKIQMSPS